MNQNLAVARLGSDSPVRHPPPAMNILFKLGRPPVSANSHFSGGRNFKNTLRTIESPPPPRYRKIRNLYLAELRAAERLYFKELGRSLTSDSLGPAQWWKKAKRACGWSGQQEMQSLTVNGNIVSSTSDRAAVLCQQFQQQCSAFPPVTSRFFSKNDSSGHLSSKK